MVKGSLVGSTGMDRLLDKKGRQIQVEVFKYSLWGKKTISEIKAKCWSTELMKWAKGCTAKSERGRRVNIWYIIKAAWSPP